MDKASELIGKISQSDVLEEIAEVDPAAARLFDRTFRLIITYGIGRAINRLSHSVMDGEYSIAAIATAILYLRQARASKKYRDLEHEDKVREEKPSQG